MCEIKHLQNICKNVLESSMASLILLCCRFTAECARKRILFENRSISNDAMVCRLYSVASPGFVRGGLKPRQYFSG